jgi:hypothetical protein
MRNASVRKLTRFYVINPVGDRRLEQRFESREDVVLKVLQTGKLFPSVAYDLGRYGMRLETESVLHPSMDVEVVFPNTPDQVHCYGRVVWGRSKSSGYEYGIAVEAWHGVIRGENSWAKYKGVRPKLERRVRPR